MARKVRWNKQLVEAWLQKKGFGELVDDEFEDTRHWHTWRCKSGHEFSQKLDYIRANESFCKECEPRYKRQEYTRFVFQQLTNERFDLRRNLDWLRNDRGNRNCLELDGYNEELSIAFEYDGGQHEQRVEAWQDENEFEELQRKDRLKDALCREKGIALIRIGHEVKTDEIEAHVTAEIRRNGLGHVIVGTVDNSNYISIVQDEFLSEARKYAEEHGGECRSELILTTSDPVIFYCPIHDHDWHVSLSALRSRPTWCLHCSHAAIGERNKKRAKQDFEARIGKGKEPLDKMATNFSGYKCHSDIPVDEYIDRETEYQWECPDEAHPPFPLSYKKAQQAHKRGQPHICPKCNKKERITIEQMHDFAKNNGGTCLTKKLDKAGDSVVEFKCKAKEHKIFTRTATQVKNNSKLGRLWCPDCPGGKTAKHDLEFVKSLCEDNNCELQAKEYHDNHTKMNIKCKKCSYEFEESLKTMRKWVRNGDPWCEMCFMLESY